MRPVHSAELERSQQNILCSKTSTYGTRRRAKIADPDVGNDADRDPHLWSESHNKLAKAVNVRFEPSSFFFFVVVRPVRRKWLWKGSVKKCSVIEKRKTSRHFLIKSQLSYFVFHEKPLNCVLLIFWYQLFICMSAGIYFFAYYVAPFKFKLLLLPMYIIDLYIS